MNELFELLSSTQEIVSAEISTPGFEIKLNSRIINVEKFEDGVTLYFENESSFFVSKILAEVVGEDRDGNFNTYYLIGANNALLTLTVPT